MTHLRAILAIVRKDALEIALDRAKLAVLVGPIALTLLYLLVGRVISGHTTAILVYNPSNSRLEQVVGSAFATSHTTQADSPGAVTAAFGSNGSDKKATYDVGLIIPADFEQSLRAGGHPHVELYLNGATITDQQRVLLQAAITNYARTVTAPIPPASLVTAIINPQPTRRSLSFSFSEYYSNLVLPISFAVGITLMPWLLIEEKEKKTLRMLMASPASFSDVALGKVVVTLGCQLAISLLVLAIIGGFIGNTPLMLLYTLLGACFAVVVGLFLGSVLPAASAAGGLGIPIIFAFIIPAIFIPLAPYLSGNPILQIIKFLPTYYFADGVFNALHNQGSLSGNALDIGVIVGATLVILLLSLWVLRRQASVAATL